MAIDLNMSPRTMVFRKIESILRNDPTLKRVVKTWRTWEGKTTDVEPLTPIGGPAIRLTPVNGEERFVFPDAQKGQLIVGIEAAVAGTFVDDPTNLWWAIERAIYPPDQTARQNIQQALNQAGSTTGLCTFSPPSYQQDEGNINWFVSGQIKTEVLLNLNA